MITKKECVAMLLAGGQGSRLYALTKEVAKPAVSYGSKHKIIDFPLSNCVNSNIDTVGVLTQYQPLILNEYIGNGHSWDLDRTYGGIHILPPYQGKTGSDWYKGTANAIYQNINFIKRYSPDYVLILSGDHIYKMNYSKMLEFHKQKQADITIAVIDVPLEEASRFGIMSSDENMRIYDFEEKPKNPKSTNASMGIYIFSTDVLYKYLEEDEKNPNSKNDFGHNIIPKMLADGMKMYAYPFEGYWKDVGTISSLWEANMDLLGDNPEFVLSDKSWKIYSHNDPYPPQYLAPGCKLNNSLITVGCEIFGEVANSVLSENVTVKKGAIVHNSVIFGGVVIDEGAVVNNAIIAENVVVGKNAIVGKPLEDGSKITVVGAGVKIAEKAVVDENQMIESDVEA